MCRILKLAAVLLLAVPVAFASDITFDRVLAVVNGSPLLQSDLEDAERFEALQRGTALSVLSDPEQIAAFDRLVERELIHQEMRSVYQPTAEEIEQQEQVIRAQFPKVRDDQGWRQLVSSYGFTEDDLHAAIAGQLQTLRFIDIRLRPVVRVDRGEIEDYYRDHLLPELKARGATPDPLSIVSSKIEQLLVEQKMNEIFSAWMTNLRSQSKIQVFDPSLVPKPQPVQGGE
jgi:peptidyl-prolyl cis-trans isomerase SurA